MVMVNEVIWLIAMRMKLKMKNTSDKYDTNTTQIWHKYDINTTQIDLGLNMDRDIVNIKGVSPWWCLCISSNTKATLKTLSNTELKKDDCKKSELTNFYN